MTNNLSPSVSLLILLLVCIIGIGHLNPEVSNLWVISILMTFALLMVECSQTIRLEATNNEQI